MTLDIKSNELEHKFMKERVNSVEKQLADISSKVSSYVKKLASLRDAGDDVAKSISDLASAEKYNQTLRLSVGEFSDVLFSIQEYREAQVNRMQIKVVHELDSFIPVCKQAKAEIKKSFDAREKVLKRKTELEKMRSKSPPNWQKIAQAEKEVNQAQSEATSATQELSKQIENFERKKIEDLKKMFMELVKIEMIFQVKTIELYTKSYNILAKIEVDEDLREFKSYFRGINCNTALAVPQTNLSPPTSPKVAEAPEEVSHSQPIPAFRGTQGRPRSIFTLNSRVPNIGCSSSSMVSSTTALSESEAGEKLETSQDGQR